MTLVQVERTISALQSQCEKGKKKSHIHHGSPYFIFMQNKYFHQDVALPLLMARGWKGMLFKFLPTQTILILFLHRDKEN